MELELEIEKLEIFDLIKVAEQYINLKDYDAYKECQKEFIRKVKSGEIELTQDEIDAAWKLNYYIQDNLIFVPLLHHNNMNISKEERTKEKAIDEIYKEIINSEIGTHKEIIIRRNLNNKNYTIRVIIDCKS